jgi:hypothetical protein
MRIEYYCWITDFLFFEEKYGEAIISLSQEELIHRL